MKRKADGLLAKHSHDKSGFGATAIPKTEARIDFRFSSMAAFAEAHKLESAGLPT